MECELDICLNLLAEQTFILSLVLLMDCSVSGRLDQLLRENIRNPLSSRSVSAKLYSTQKSRRILNEHCKVQKDSFQSTVSSFNLNSVLSTIPQLFQLVPYVENPRLLSLQGIFLQYWFSSTHLQTQFFTVGRWDKWDTQGRRQFNFWPLKLNNQTQLRWFPSFALRISNAHDFYVISARKWARARTKRKRFPSN